MGLTSMAGAATAVVVTALASLDVASWLGTLDAEDVAAIKGLAAAVGVTTGIGPSLAGATRGSTVVAGKGSATADVDVEIGADAGIAATTTPCVEAGAVELVDAETCDLSA